MSENINIEGIDETKRIHAYNMKTKEKKVPMYDAKIDKVVRGNRTIHVAKGTTMGGVYNLSTILSAVNADIAINAGVARRGEGWD